MDYSAAIILAVCLKFSAAQDANCDFSQDVTPGVTYYAHSPNYPDYYPGGVQCRWIATCPSGYNCALQCTDINLPQSSSCKDDRLLISRSGDPVLNAAQTYCGQGTLSVVSTAQTISIGLIAPYTSAGGRFLCELTAQPAAVTPQRCSCGYKRTNRIVGGQETGINEYPSMAGVVEVSISQIKCGGVIISDRYILTAAHCVKDKKPSDLAIIVGEHDVTTGDSPATKGFKVAEITKHPLFDESNYDYDIALIQIDGQITYSSRVGPVCLPFKYVNADFSGVKVTMLGWGTQFPGGPTSNVLQQVDVDVISSSSCRRNVSNLSERQFCTYTRGKDACQDDSGGPLLFTDPTTGLMFNIGIISYGKSCASAEPGINTMVFNSAILQWIIANTPGANYCQK